MRVTNLWLSFFLVLIAFSGCSPEINKATFVLLPDTQTYAEKYPEVMDAQVDWVVKEAANIDLVLQQGDLTQNNNDEEWQRVQNAFKRLNGKVPYVLAVGNHDMGSGPGKFADVRNTTLYNSYFPYSTMASLPAFGGAFEENKTDNAYYLLETGKHKWMVLTLEFGPRESVLQWANKVVEDHQDRMVILNTHAYMYSDSTRQHDKDWWRPQAYGIGKDTAMNAVNDGEQIWKKLVKQHPNIRFVFSGHVLHTGVGTLVSINDAGLPVYQMLANYQEGVKGSIKGGNGWLRILELDFKDNSITVKTYSPYINEYKEEPAHQFKIESAFLKPGKDKK
ncbi:metallophosphoesterase [Botryobacter ruber]|uniref:metallophosphoesterase n=1 Tax=Botryobacter ruber TaxID=2171629 RepID=UPI00196BB065|nr:metallophosphoesterase [Botryobacter ruber]